MRILIAAALTLAGVSVSVNAAAPAAPAAAAPAKPDAASARAYVQAIYDRYAHEELFGIFGANEAKYFDASTLALLRRDEKLLNGDEGAIGADYMCVCQDSSGMRATVGDVTMAGPNAAKAPVTIRFMAEAGTPMAHVDIDLVFEKGGWRIHDIRARDSDGHDWDSVRTVLTREIRELSAGH